MSLYGSGHVYLILLRAPLKSSASTLQSFLSLVACIAVIAMSMGVTSVHMHVRKPACKGLAQYFLIRNF